MAKLTTTWEQQKPFNLTGCKFWGAADNSSDGSRLYDLSGHGDLVNGSNPPANFNYAETDTNLFYFDGTKNPLSRNGAVTLKHVFIVGAVDGAAFNGSAGLLSGVSGQEVLTGYPGQNYFSGSILPANTIYKKLDLGFTLATPFAPMAGTLAIIEMIFPTGLALNGLQIGQAGAHTTGKFKGWFGELICYSLRKGWHTRMDIYRYFAKKYFLFRELFGGVKIFPFPNNHASPHQPLRYKIQSPALPSGKIKTRVKGSKLQQYDFNYTVRRQDEIDAVEAFEDRYFDGRTIAVENNSYYPPRRVNIVPVSDVSVDPQSVNLFGYKWSGRQTDTSEEAVVVDFDEIKPKPSIPSNFTFTADSATEFRAEWDAAANAASYEIEISL